jgi:putative endonuclease
MGKYLNKKIGDKFEKEAKDFFTSKGLIFLDQNVTYFFDGKKFGEIDLIFLDKKENNNTIVFIEVKYRSSNKFGNVLETLSKSKIKRLYEIGELYLENIEKKVEYTNNFKSIFLLYARTNKTLELIVID